MGQMFKENSEMDNINDSSYPIGDREEKKENIQDIIALHKELADLKYALDESSIIAITDPRGIIKSANKKFCDISKYSREELIGQDHRILNSGYHSKEFFREMWRTIGSGKVWIGEIRNKAKDGSLYWVHTTIVPILNEKGKPYRYISLRVDITKQKQMEAALQKALKDDFNQTVKNLKFTQRKLQENQLLYQSLFHYSQDAVFMFDIKSKILNMNPATEKLLGYSLEHIHNTSLSTLIVEEFQSITVHCFEKALKGEPQNFDTIAYHKSGEKIHVNLTYVPIIVDNEITAIYCICKDITEKKKAQELNAYLAQHDELTKLFNRRGFESKLKRAISAAKESGHKLAVMYIDFDRFKNINDTLGHFIGDCLLEQIAQRLKTYLDEEYCIARMGGDEFMVLCPVIKQEDDAAGNAEAILTCIKDPFFIEQYELYVTASIGISIFPAHGDTVIDLMKHADIALYKAKEQGRNTYQIYSTRMNQLSYQSFFMERDLRKALNNNEFIVHLQPRVDANTRQIISAEALIRWNHPKFGLIPPSEFIPLAEETGLIIPMGKWMKRRVCELLAEWRKTGKPLIPISINISAQCFFQKDFAKCVSQILTEFGLEGNLLEFEITENSLMRNEEEVLETIYRLKELGIKIYIDDFGTGYSSFSYLKSFKIDGIKIDRSFIHNISSESENAGITSAMIHLAHLLKTEVIAEGVETIEELMFLRENHCHQIQGYLFGKPAPIEEFEKNLVSGTM
jgi:diguanylate cyclase (GGDEF)-like protein/PAS domain S-box-containing protein